MSGDDDDRDHAEEPRTGAAGGDGGRQAPDGPAPAPAATVLPLSSLRYWAAPDETRPPDPDAAGAGDASDALGEEPPAIFPLADLRRRRLEAERRSGDSARAQGAYPGVDRDRDDRAETGSRDEGAHPDAAPAGAAGFNAAPPDGHSGGRRDEAQSRTLEEAQRSAEALIALEKTILSLLKEPSREAPVEKPVFRADSASGPGRPAPPEIRIFRPAPASADWSPRPPVQDARFQGDGREPPGRLFRGAPPTPPERILATSERTDREMHVPFEIEPFLPTLVHEIDALPVEEPAEPAPEPRLESAAQQGDGPAAAAARGEPDRGSAGPTEAAAPEATPRLDASPAGPEAQPRRGREVAPVRARPAPVLVADNAGLAAEGIGKRFKQRQVLRGVSLTLQRGEVVGLLGPNGAGKTTCFYIITGLISADYGTILLDDKDITSLPMYRRARLGIGYLPQEPSIFRGLNVENNIRSVLESVAPERDVREAMLDDLLAEFSITHLRRTPALALSGGERRRVEIARALASQPNFILLDEPLAGIDPIALGDIRDLVAHLKDRGIGVLITDHNVRETLEIVDRAYIIYNGEMLMSGKPSEIVSHDDVRRVYLGDGFTL